MNLPDIPQALSAQIEQVVQLFHTKLLTRSCVPQTTGVSTFSVSAIKMTDELIKKDDILDEMFADDETHRKFLRSHALLSYCVVWSYWALVKKNDTMYKNTLYLYGCSIYFLLARKYFQFCDNARFQLALQKVPVRSNYYNRTHMAVVTKTVDMLVEKPVATTQQLFLIYAQLKNTLNQSMKHLAEMYYDTTQGTEFAGQNIDIPTILRSVESSIDFVDDAILDLLSHRYNLRKSALMCFFNWHKKYRTFVKMWEGALYKHPATTQNIMSRLWFRKVEEALFASEEFKQAFKITRDHCALEMPRRYWVAFFEHIHNRIKANIQK